MNGTQQTTKKKTHQEHHFLFGFEESDPEVAGVVSPGCQVIPSFTVSKAELGIPRSFDLTTFSDRKRWFTIFFQQKQVSDAGTYDYIKSNIKKNRTVRDFCFWVIIFLRREFHCWTFGDRTWGTFLQRFNASRKVKWIHPLQQRPSNFFLTGYTLEN